MKLTPLTAISPIDGRYHQQTICLSTYFSEYALIKYRILIEIEYFISLCQMPLPSLNLDFSQNSLTSLRNVYMLFSIKDATRVKEIETSTNHDVKAVEYFIKEKLDVLQLGKYKEFVHFGLTSQDINNTAIPLAIKEMIELVYLPLLKELLHTLQKKRNEWKNIPMLAWTHGQPASPTCLGKEIQVFISRLNQQINLLKNIPITAKFGGATGNYNAHLLAYPNIDWQQFGNDFIEKKLGLIREQHTTQISNYDNLSALFDSLKRINTILLDLSKDFWQYISKNYFKQKIIFGEIGSSTMPHKVNPINFENAEGNLGISNALLEYLSAKLPISRLQRDLTDSTVLRTVGVPISHIIIALQSLQKGFSKIILNKWKIKKDLNNSWGVIAEGIQTILRRENYPNPYETLKLLTRKNKKITRISILNFINNLPLHESIKEELRTITPHNYIGYSSN